ncbi:MAG: thiopurine S-methyltransferase [Pseudomonadales bacterium]
MEFDFWLNKWKRHEIGFHLDKVNPVLIDHIGRLPLPKDGRLFLPLCGKTLDIGWLLSQGYRVVGCELSELAVNELFGELEVQPDITELVDGLHYSTHNIDIFVYDIFKLSSDMLGRVDATYDRAALVALPMETRPRYATHLTALTASAPQLLITLVYDQNEMAGPPFSVIDEEVRTHYRDSYEPTLLASADVPGGLKGKCAALENVWLLS